MLFGRFKISRACAGAAPDPAAVDFVTTKVDAPTVVNAHVDSAPAGVNAVTVNSAGAAPSPCAIALEAVSASRVAITSMITESTP